MMPEQVSSYRLEGEIARGGMGVVFRGVHIVFGEVVAVKAIFPELMLNPDFRDRFLNEARIQRRLQHPNIVQIREFLAEQGGFYIIMEFIQGDTLSHHLKRLGRPMATPEALGIFRQILEGLAYAHAQGVIHRDIKPSNIMLTQEGAAKLTDFGIARGADTAKLTRTGMALGTPAYMSPEQIQGSKVDQRTDIYSLGVMLYELMAGRVPFLRPEDSDSDFPILTAHTSQSPPPPRQFAPEIPSYIESAIMKALAKRPEDRFQTCKEFQQALGLDPAPTGGLTLDAAARPVAPAKLLASLPVGGAAREPAAPKPCPPSPPPSPSRQPVMKPPMAKLVRKTEPRRIWPLVLAVTVLVLALAGAVAWRFSAARGGYELKDTLTGHQGEVTSVAFSPDGRLLASGSVDRTIKLWDVATRQLKQTLAAHENYVESVAFSPDGHLLASGSTDKTIKLWEVATGSLRQTLKGNGNSVLSVAFSPDGRFLASGTWGKTIEIWDVASGTLKQSLAGHLASVSAVTFSPDGRFLVSGSDDMTIKVWDVASWEVVRTLIGHEDKVTSLAFSPDGRLLASGSADATIRLWDVASWGLVQTLRGHKGWVRSVAFSPDGRLLASGSHDMTVAIWGVPSGKEIQILNGHEYDVQSVAFSMTSRMIASGSRDQTIKLWRRAQ